MSSNPDTHKPALPEPACWAQLGLLNGRSYVRFTYDSHPYPPHADVARNLNLVPLYTSAAIEAAVAEARAVPEQVQLPYFNRREVERQVESSENPSPGTLRFNDSKERVTLPGGTLRRMLQIIDMLSATPSPTMVNAANTGQGQPSGATSGVTPEPVIGGAPLPTPPARVALSDEQIVMDGLMMTPSKTLESGAAAFEAGVRFAEKHHGITPAQGAEPSTSTKWEPEHLQDHPAVPRG